LLRCFDEELGDIADIAGLLFVEGDISERTRSVTMPFTKRSKPKITKADFQGLWKPKVVDVMMEGFGIFSYCGRVECRGSWLAGFLSRSVAERNPQ
jgi:hypothetical protein